MPFAPATTQSPASAPPPRMCTGWHTTTGSAIMCAAAGKEWWEHAEGAMVGQRGGSNPDGGAAALHLQSKGKTAAPVLRHSNKGAHLGPLPAGWYHPAC